jgi:hypothetical protein
MRKSCGWLAWAAIPSVVVIFLGGPASADCHGSGDTEGSGHKTVGAGTQDLSWNLSSRSTSVSSVTNSSMLTSVCLEARSDWITSSGHYDARASRNCRPGSSRSGTLTDPSGWGGRSVNGLQKAAGCEYNQATSPTTYSVCQYVVASIAGCGFPSDSARPWTAWSHAVFLRAQDGSLQFNNGGVVSDPNN